MEWDKIITAVIFCCIISPALGWYAINAFLGLFILPKEGE